MLEEVNDRVYPGVMMRLPDSRYISVSVYDLSASTVQSPYTVWTPPSGGSLVAFAVGASRHIARATAIIAPIPINT